MKVHSRFVILLILVFGFVVSGRIAISQGVNWPCDDPSIRVQEFPAVVISMEHQDRPYYCPKHDQPPKPGLPMQFRDGKALKVVVIGIDPVGQSCKVSFKDNPIQESAFDSLVKDLSVSVSSGAKTQKTEALPATAVSPQEEPNPQALTEAFAGKAAECVEKFRKLDEKVHTLQTTVNGLTDRINGLVTDSQADLQEYNDLITRAETRPNNNWDDTVQSAQRLLNNVSTNARADMAGEPFDKAISNLANEAADQWKNLEIGDACRNRSDLQKQFSVDEDFLKSVFTQLNGKPSLQSSWTKSVTSLTAMKMTLTSAVDILIAQVKRPEATQIVKLVPDTNQTVETVTIACTAQKSPLVKINVTQNDSSGQESSDASTGAGTTSAAKADAKADPSTTTTTFNLQFGYGPRVYESAGIVFADLQQHSFSTAAAGSGPTCPAKVGTTAATSCIVDDANTGWRVLPMVIGSFRFADPRSKTARHLLPYASVGATVKSTGNGTSLEYLLGPSWPLAHRYLFLTGGAYAGQETHLGGGLKVGPQTVTLPSTLPTSSSYQWGFGFAVTFKIGQQQGKQSTSTSAKDTSGSGGGS